MGIQFDFQLFDSHEKLVENVVGIPMPFGIINVAEIATGCFLCQAQIDLG